METISHHAPGNLRGKKANSTKVMYEMFRILGLSLNFGVSGIQDPLNSGHSGSLKKSYSCQQGRLPDNTIGHPYLELDLLIGVE